MKTQRMLLNNFSVSGNDLDSFKKHVTQMADSTEVLSVKGSEMTFLSVCDVKKIQTEGSTIFYILNAENVEDFLDYRLPIRLGSVKNEDLGEELLQELLDTTKLIMVVDDVKYIISKSTLTTLAQRACVSGDTTVSRNNLARDLHLADALFYRNERINFVYRHCNGINKVFAAFSSDYILNRQDIIIKALEHEDFPFKEYTVKNYSINNSITELYLELPSKNQDIKPGLIIRNSDIGDSSLIVRVIYWIGDAYAIVSESSLRHDRGFTFERFMENVLVEAKKSFDYSTFSEELDKLKDTSIMDYSKFDPLSKDDRENNFSVAEELLTEGIFFLYHHPLSKTKKAYKSLCRNIIDNINSEKEYSYFDIASILLNAPEHLSELDAPTVTNLRKAASNIPDFFHKKIFGK